MFISEQYINTILENGVALLREEKGMFLTVIMA